MKNDYINKNKSINISLFILNVFVITQMTSSCRNEATHHI